jgi:mannose-6-phosphate isomerase
MTDETCYPLLVERKFVYRMWGGRRIAEWLRLPEPHPNNVGETWEVYDTNPIRNGAMAGQPLSQAAERYGACLVGTRVVQRYGNDFPLLLKFIDANEKLSIQVHPDDSYAHANEAATGFHGKTESWYILDAKPGAEVIHGLKDTMDSASFTAAVQAETLDDQVRYVPVQAGDVVVTPPGTLHAINEGLLLFEIQQKSDLTYRVYDYGRRDPATGKQRELHLDKAMSVLRLDRTPPALSSPVALESDEERVLLMACRHFALEHWWLSQPCRLVTRRESMDIFTVVGGAVVMAWEGGSLALGMGDSIIVPAMLGDYTLSPVEQPTRLLRAYIPDEEHDIRRPLREQGLSDEAIARVLFTV